MTYGPPPGYSPPGHPEYPEYPRATSSPPIILLVSGLAALLGFLLGVFVGFGAGTTSQEPEPRVTVTVEDTEPPLSDPPPSDPAQTQPQTTPSQTVPSQPVPGQTTPGQPGTNQPGTSQSPTPGGTTTGPAINPASLRTLVVGRDIQPGTYRTTGPAAGFPMCFWARMNNTTADAAVIDSGTPAGPTTVTIQPTDKAFQTGGCAEWTRA